MRVLSSEFNDLCQAGMMEKPFIAKVTPSRKNKSLCWICGAVSKTSGIVMSIDNGGSEIKYKSVNDAVKYLVSCGFSDSDVSFGIP